MHQAEDHNQQVSRRALLLPQKCKKPLKMSGFLHLANTIKLVLVR